MSTVKNSNAAALQDQQAYSSAWAGKMADIWQERIARLRLVDTGQLLRSVSAMVTPGAETSIELSFMAYGIHVARGVGRNFLRSRQGGGTVPFLLPGGEQYRREHGLDKPKPIGPAWHRSKNSPGSASKREAGGRPMRYDPTSSTYRPRDFYSSPLYRSRIVLGEAMRRIYGQAFQGLLVETGKLLNQKD